MFHFVPLSIVFSFEVVLLFKRIIALFAVFAILFSSFPRLAFASEPSMGNANFWEWATSLDASHPWYRYGQRVLDWFFRVKKGDDSPCPNGVGGVHQWQFLNIGSQVSGKVYCSWCGKEYADVCICICVRNDGIFQE